MGQLFFYNPYIKQTPGDVNRSTIFFTNISKVIAC